MLNYSLDSDEGDTCYAKLLLASPDEVLKQVIDHVMQPFMSCTILILNVANRERQNFTVNKYCLSNQQHNVRNSLMLNEHTDEKVIQELLHRKPHALTNGRRKVDDE